MSSRRRADNRTPEEKAADKLRYHEEHHVTVQQFKEIIRTLKEAFKAHARLGKKLDRNGPTAILSWQDVHNPAVSYTYTHAQRKVDFDYLLKKLIEVNDFHRLSKSRPGAKSSANTTPTAIGPVLQGLFFPADIDGYYAAIPDGVIAGLPNGTSLMSQLPLAKSGLVLRSTLLEIFYLYAWTRNLDDPNDGRRLRIDEAINAAFNGQVPALFTKVAVGLPKQKRKNGQVVLEQKYDRASNPANLNTIGAIRTYKPDYRPGASLEGVPPQNFGAGSFMGSSDFQILSALNYFPADQSLGRVQELLAAFAQQGRQLTVDQLRGELAREYELVRAVRKYYKAQRDADPSRQAIKRSRNEASKAKRKKKTKTGAVTVDLGNGQSYVKHVAPTTNVPVTL